jgi:Zn-dependent protease with chaperone function
MLNPSQRVSWKPIILLIGLLSYGVLPLLTSNALNLSSQRISFQTQNQGASLSSPDSSSPKGIYSLPPDKLSKAIRLSRIRNVLHFASALWGIAFLWLLLSTRISAAMASWAAKCTRNYWLQGLIFLPVLLLLLTLSDLPLASYQHHLSLSYGLSVQHWTSWFGDWGKSLLLSIVFGTLILLLFMLIVRKSPQRYWFWFWVASIPIMIFTVFAFPIFIEPLFDHFEPLAKSDPALVQQLERVVARTGTQIPPERMFLMKASEKSTGLNAYVTGLGSSKRVVVWDTTIQKLPTDDILFIFGHESGHYVLNHIWRGIGATSIFLFFLFLAGSYLVRRAISGKGQAWSVESTTSWAALPLFLLVVTTLSFVTEPVVNGFSRMQEHQADVYGQEAIHGIVANPQQTAVHSFQALGEAYLDDPNPSRWIEFWIYDHPSVKTRAAFAANYDPWQASNSPRYFKK